MGQKNRPFLDLAIGQEKKDLKESGSHRLEKLKPYTKRPCASNSVSKTIKKFLALSRYVVNNIPHRCTKKWLLFHEQILLEYGYCNGSTSKHEPCFAECYRSAIDRKTENSWLLVPYSIKANLFCDGSYMVHMFVMSYVSTSISVFGRSIVTTSFQKHTTT